MKRSSIIIGAVVIVALLIIAASYFGLIPGLASLLPGGNDGEIPPGDAVDCSFTDLEILNMLEIISGKDLNNQQGLAFVDALNMRACGQNDKTYTEIVSYYKVQYVDWTLIGEQSYTGSGWDADALVWGNDASSPTEAKSIITGSGVSIESFYGYSTMTITASGTWAAYQAFALWLLAS